MGLFHLIGGWLGGSFGAGGSPAYEATFGKLTGLRVAVLRKATPVFPDTTIKCRLNTQLTQVDP